MSIKTPKRIVLAVIASLVVAPLVAIAPASADNVAVRVTALTADTDNVNNPGQVLDIAIAGRTASTGLTGDTAEVSGDTVTLELALVAPSGSKVTLKDRDGGTVTDSPVYVDTTDDFESATFIDTAKSVVRLTASVDKDPISALDLGTLRFTPDISGDYVFTVYGTDEDGDRVSTVFATVTIKVVDPAVNQLANPTSTYELQPYSNSDDVSILEEYICYEDENVDENRNYIEYAFAPTNGQNVFSIENTGGDLDPIVDDEDNVNGKLRLSITGPAVWTNTDEGQIQRGGKVILVDGGEATIDWDYSDFAVTGLGTVSISIHEVLDSGVTRSAGTFTVEAVATCSNDIYDADESGVRVQANATALTAKPIADVAGASTVARGGTGFIAVYLADVNGDLLESATNTLVATSTAAVTLGWGGVGTVATSSIAGAAASNAVLYVRAATTGAVLSAPIEIKLNGTLVATKTISFTGPAETIEISAKKVSVATSATTAEAFKVRVKDSAGNGVTSGAASVFTVDGTYVTAATAATASATAATGVSVTCSALRGKGSVTLAWGVPATKREVVEVICAGGIASFEVTTSKTAYDRAEIGVLTISAKDLAGNPVPDGTALATAAAKIQFTGSGATLAKATGPAATDTFTDGKIDYAFTTSATAGSYNFALWHADLSPAVTKIAQFTVNAAVVAPTYTKPTLTASIEGGRVLLFGACEADEGDMVVYVKRPGGAWNEKAKTLECVAGEYDGSVIAPKATRLYRVKQEGTGLWSGSALVRR